MTDFWGDLPTWIGSSGTLGAVLWGVWLYARGESDRRRASARLLSPLAPVSFHINEAGYIPQGPCCIAKGIRWAAPDGQLVMLDRTASTVVTIKSASAEMFTDVCCWAVMPSGMEVWLEPGWRTMPPNETMSWTHVLPLHRVEKGAVDIKVWFTDSLGRRWERSSFGGLRRRKRRENVPEDRLSLPVPTAYSPNEQAPVRALGMPPT